MTSPAARVSRPIRLSPTTAAAGAALHGSGRPRPGRQAQQTQPHKRNTSSRSPGRSKPGGSKLQDYTVQHADISSPISRKVSGPQTLNNDAHNRSSPTTSDNLPARRFPRAKPLPGADMLSRQNNGSFLLDSSNSSHGGQEGLDVSGQSQEEMIQFRVRNPNSITTAPVVPPPVVVPRRKNHHHTTMVPLQTNEKQLLLSQNHKALHAIVEEDKKMIRDSVVSLTVGELPGQDNHSSSGGSLNDKDEDEDDDDSSSSAKEDHPQDDPHTGLLLGTQRTQKGLLEDSAASMGIPIHMEDDSSQNHSCMSVSMEEQEDSTVMAEIAEARKKQKEKEELLALMSQRSSTTTTCTEEDLPLLQRIPSSQRDATADPAKRDSLVATATAASTNHSNKYPSDKDRLIKAAANAVQDVPPPKSRRARRATSGSGMMPVYDSTKNTPKGAPESMTKGRLRTRSAERALRNDNDKTNTIPTSIDLGSSGGMDGSGQWMEGSGRTGGLSERRTLRRAKSSDGSDDALGRMRRIARMRGGGGAGTDASAPDATAMPDTASPRRRLPLRTRSTDGSTMPGRMIPRDSVTKRQSVRRSRSTASDVVVGDDHKPPRSLSPASRRRVINDSFGAAHPSRFNSSRIKRWDKSSSPSDGLNKSAHEKHMAKMMQSNSGGLLL